MQCELHNETQKLQPEGKTLHEVSNRLEKLGQLFKSAFRETQEEMTGLCELRHRDSRVDMGDGRWEMGDGRWEMGDGRWSKTTKPGDRNWKQ